MKGDLTLPHGDTNDSLNEMAIHSTFVLFSCFRAKGHVVFRCYCCNKNLYFLAGKCYNYGAMGHIQAQCGRRRRRERKPHSGDSDVRENEIQYHFHGTVKNLKKLK